MQKIQAVLTVVALIISGLVIHQYVQAAPMPVAGVAGSCVKVQPDLHTLADEVLPAVALKGWTRTELLNLGTGVYVTWTTQSEDGNTHTVHLTIWRYGNGQTAKRQEIRLDNAETLQYHTTIDGMPSSYLGGDDPELAATSDALFSQGNYVMRVQYHTHGDPGAEFEGSVIPKTEAIAQSVFSRLTLITG